MSKFETREDFESAIHNVRPQSPIIEVEDSKITLEMDTIKELVELASRARPCEGCTTNCESENIYYDESIPGFVISFCNNLRG